MTQRRFRIRDSLSRVRERAARRYSTARRSWRIRRAPRRVFVDCGANTCTVLRSFIEQYPDFEFFAFEPQPELQDAGRQVVRDHPDTKITFFDKAVWIRDEPLEFFLATQWGPNHRGGSTVVHGHTKNRSAVDYEHPIQVAGIDFSRWLGENVRPRDYVIVKMDIEGAEYDVLEKLIQDGHLSLVDEMIVEFHRRMNDEISDARHRRVRDAVRASVELMPWH